MNVCDKKKQILPAENKILKRNNFNGRKFKVFRKDLYQNEKFVFQKNYHVFIY